MTLIADTTSTDGSDRCVAFCFVTRHSVSFPLNMLTLTLTIILKMGGPMLVTFTLHLWPVRARSGVTAYAKDGIIFVTPNSPSRAQLTIADIAVILRQQFTVAMMCPAIT